MNITRHAAERITERLTDAGVSEARIEAALKQAVRRGAEAKLDEVAIRLEDLGAQVNAAWGDRSNGDTLWGIYRGGSIVTIMLRRSSQPSTAKALRVSRVIL